MGVVSSDLRPCARKNAGILSGVGGRSEMALRHCSRRAGTSVELMLEMVLERGNLVKTEDIRSLIAIPKCRSAVKASRIAARKMKRCFGIGNWYMH